MDLNTLFNTPRGSQQPLFDQNSVRGLYDLVHQFYKPDFKMVEVGSFEGVSTLLFASCVNTVYSVDCYDYKVPPTGRIPSHDRLFVEAERLFISRTKDVKNIVKIRKTSVEAAKDFEDYSLDAVYIDAEHDEDSVREDIRTWTPKLKRGGILSGHDFNLPHIKRILVEEQGYNPQHITVALDTSWAVVTPTIDLVAVACTKVPETIEALRRCQEQMKFSRTILLTHEEVQAEGIEVIKIPQLDYKGYNEFVAMTLWQYVAADFALLVQNDGYITNASKWTEEFLNYDYIGSGWPVPSEEDKISYRTPNGRLVRVGNGGFSLRSRKLLRAPTILGLEFTDNGTGFWHEDGNLCVYHRDALENAGIRFAPVEVAVRFSQELPVPEAEGIEPFGHHKYLPKSE